jgi:cytochrome P450
MDYCPRWVRCFLKALFKFNLSGLTYLVLGHHHKKQRKMLNPVFSTANMRTMSTFYRRLLVFPMLIEIIASQFFNISYKVRHS